MIAILDYGVGNLFSLRSSLEAIEQPALITADPALLRAATHIVLPGVGAFRDAAQKLSATGLIPVLRERVAAGVPLMGICLGMQLLFEKSYEYGEYEGLGFLPGSVRPIADVIPAGLKVPHMGWNPLQKRGDHPLLADVGEGECVYFVHSYYADTPAENIIAVAEYGAPLTAAVAKGCVMGCQFHPEKSGEVGLKILRAFCRMKAGAPC